MIVVVDLLVVLIIVVLAVIVVLGVPEKTHPCMHVSPNETMPSMYLPANPTQLSMDVDPYEQFCDRWMNLLRDDHKDEVP